MVDDCGCLVSKSSNATYNLKMINQTLQITLSYVWFFILATDLKYYMTTTINHYTVAKTNLNKTFIKDMTSPIFSQQLQSGANMSSFSTSNHFS